jgi:hypothetical protein
MHSPPHAPRVDLWCFRQSCQITHCKMQDNGSYWAQILATELRLQDFGTRLSNFTNLECVILVLVSNQLNVQILVS